MGKRLLIGFIAVTSLLAFQGGVAEAGCLKWANVGGSNICCTWSPKGVAATVEFNQACPQETVGYPGGGYGEVSTCDADVTVIARDSVAFCQDGNRIVKVPCPGSREFVQTSETQCEPKHEKDVNPGPGVGTGHEHHGDCTQRIVLRAQCQDCCIAAGFGATCQDVTPIEMDTQVRAFNPGVGGGDFAPTDGSECPPGANCVFNEHCSINPNKLKFIDPALGDAASSNQTYQCEFTCVSDNAYDCPPPQLCEGEFCE